MRGMKPIDERVLGGLLGVCIGDALGVPVEGASRSYLKDKPVRGFGYKGVFRVVPDGWWSDDSSLTLCLAECLVPGELDLNMIAHTFCRWLYEGYWTSGGSAFGMGRTTARALERIRRGENPLQSGEKGEYSNGNGSLMRILPMAFYLRGRSGGDFYEAVHSVSSITHAHPRSLIACGMYVQMALHLLDGREIGESYELMCGGAPHYYAEEPFAKELKAFRRVLEGSLCRLTVDAVHSSGYVVDTLEAALWCLLNGGSFEESVLSAVNMGGDTDTTAAVLGGLAGMYYGRGSIPPHWISTLARSDDIVALGKRMCKRLSM
jgi:ADP-ribosyl-[dinitrogen reductase] hydrolase